MFKNYDRELTTTLQSVKMTSSQVVTDKGLTHAEQRSSAAGVMVTVLTHGLVVEQRHSANKHEAQ